MSSATLLKAEGLVFRWRRGQAPCLDVADFEIQPGERLFVHGPSGSGKSTLLGLLGGVLRPEQGRIALQVDGRAVVLNALSDRARDRFRVDHIGFVFQQFNLVPYLSVLDNICLPCRFSARRRQRLAGDERTEARRLLRALDLAPALEAAPVTRLSVGQQQRVAVARALIGRPDLLIADEPTSALDAQRQAGFLDLLLQESAASGASVVFVSHDERLAGHFDRRVALGQLNRATALQEA